MFYRKRRGKGFYYVNNKNKIITNKEIIDRIKKLVIPPAWKDVQISSNINDVVQVTGIDDKDRIQYIYSNKYKLQQQKLKYKRIIEFGKYINDIRNDINKLIRKKELTKEKLVAIIIYLMDLTHFRIGNEQYTDSYGLTTLLDKHIKIFPTKVEFEFIGKKGVINRAKIYDKNIINNLLKIKNEIKPKKNERFFQYKHNNEKKIIYARDINDFLKSYSKINLTAKDFRTWSANNLFIEYIIELETPKNITNIKKNISETVKYVASQLNNTPTICKKDYCCKYIIDNYINDPENFIKTVTKYCHKPNKYNTGIESAVIYFLNKNKLN